MDDHENAAASGDAAAASDPNATPIGDAVEHSVEDDAAPTLGETAPGNVVPNDGDHDRVAMLSLHADGTPAQHNPELIGDRDAALAATRKQFVDQAVSAADVAARSSADPGDLATLHEDGTVQQPAEPVQDPSIAALAEQHTAAADVASERASEVVDALHKSGPAEVAPVETPDAPSTTV